MAYLKKEFQNQMRKNMIDNDYRVWKNDNYITSFENYNTMLHVPFDHMDIQSIKWLPIKFIDEDRDRNCYRFLMGMNDLKYNQNYIYFCEVAVPTDGQVIEVPVLNTANKLSEIDLTATDFFENDKSLADLRREANIQKPKINLNNPKQNTELQMNFVNSTIPTNQKTSTLGSQNNFNQKMPQKDENRNFLNFDFTVLSKFPVVDKIQKMEFMPQKHNIVAVDLEYSKDITIYDYSINQGVQESDNEKSCEYGKETQSSSEYTMVLPGHELYNNHINWNSLKEGAIISGGQNDGLIILWDVAAARNIDYLLQPTWKVDYGKNISDIKFNNHERNIFGVTTCCGILSLWDDRDANRSPYESVRATQEHGITSLDFNNVNDKKLAISLSNGEICIFDRRNLNKRMFTLRNHNAWVNKVEWSKVSENILASSSENRQIVLNDLSKIYNIETTADFVDTSGSVIFNHRAHRNNVVDFNWNTIDNYFLLSASRDD